MRDTTSQWRFALEVVVVRMKPEILREWSFDLRNEVSRLILRGPIITWLVQPVRSVQIAFRSACLS